MERTFGVEIEMYGRPHEEVIADLAEAGIDARHEGYHHNRRNYWKLVPDSSIVRRENGRIAHNAIELVSPVLKGEEGLETVRKVGETLKRIGQKVHSNCGLHVHFGASDLTVPQVKKITERYVKFEAEIDSVVAPSRRGDSNRYAHSMGPIAHRILNCNARSVMDLAISQGDRFHKLNLTAFQRHGTIENRHHQGTIEPEKIVNWIRFGLVFIEQSKQLAGDAPASSVNIHESITRASVGMPRRGSGTWQVANMIREGRDAAFIANIFNRPVAYVKWTVTRLNRDHGTDIRIVRETSFHTNPRTGRMDRNFSFNIVRWFNDPATASAPERFPYGPVAPAPAANAQATEDASAFDGCPEDLKSYFRGRAEYFSRREVAA